jgi:Putative peptidoglycan binding domain/LysM domain
VSTIHIVKQGDCLYRIAKQHGFADWRTIYDHADNEAFRAKRPNPNVIYPGDEIVIPDKDTKQVSLPTTTKHKLKVKRPKLMLRVELRNELDEPLAGKQFEVKFGESLYDGTTDGDGILEAKVQAGEEVGELTVWGSGDREAERWFWHIRVGHLDPVAELDGVRQRLNNLGFYCEPKGEAVDESLRLAVKGFQRIAGIDQTGEVDDATRDKLVDLHGDV